MKPIRIAIVVSDFNSDITMNLLLECRKELLRNGIYQKNIRVVHVPGAYELPFVAHRLAKTKKHDAVICLGCVIKGDTSHDEHVASWASIGIGQVALATGVPTFFGVLTPNNEKQAEERSRPGPYNRGKEVGHAAVDLVTRLRKEKL